MKTVAIIQARMGSTRLPGKVLRDINGKTMLDRVLLRTKLADLLDDVVVATTTSTVDDSIVKAAEKLGVSVFRGSESDVLDRYYRTAVLCSADVIVRITSDCPLIDPNVINHVIRAFLDTKPDYASNGLVRSYPRGLDVEVMTLSSLKKAWFEAKAPYQRTHVTPYIYQNPHLFNLLSVQNAIDYSDYRWTVDTPEDIQLVRCIYNKLSDEASFSWLDVLKICESDKSIFSINSHIKQKSLELG